jgi:methylenetetrahydrofolate reductase (NADPH)
LNPSRNAEQWRQRLIANATLEVTVRDKDAASILGERLPRGAAVHVTYLSNSIYLDTVAQAKALAKAGLEPIPHLAARSFRNAAELGDYVARLVGEAGARRLLLVAGDLDPPRGPFGSALDVLNTGLLEAGGIRGLSFAVHPEGHPLVSPQAMAQALLSKLAYAAQHDLEAELVSQFCFEAAPILDCIRDLRRRGIAAPVRIGAAAPTDPVRMMKFALRCGIGPSLRALEKHAARLGEMLSLAGPEALVGDLAEALAAEHLGAIGGMHFFVFGGLKHTAEWLQNWRGGRAAGAT